MYEWVYWALVNNKSQCIFNLFNARGAFVVTISAPKSRSNRLSVQASVCVCVAQVCASSSVYVCVCVSQSISLWLIMRTSLNKSSTTFQCHSPQLKDHSLISLAGCCPSPPSLCLFHCASLCLCLCLFPSLSLSLSLPVSLPCLPARCRRQHYPVST